MRFAMLAPCHEARSLTPALADFDPGIELMVLPTRHDHRVPQGAAGLLDHLLDELAWYGPWDGALVVLDHAASDTGCLSDARQLADRARRILGPGIPVGTLDDARHDIAAQLSDGLTVLRTLRTMASGT